MSGPEDAVKRVVDAFERIDDLAEQRQLVGGPRRRGGQGPLEASGLTRRLTSCQPAVGASLGHRVGLQPGPHVRWDLLLGQRGRVDEDVRDATLHQ